ncbi:MAG: hypothetical protein JWL95_2839 [Gemmatimonadetes bacterium]|nr:hypothetical protein [Gemmatimonadota bacterium]
MTSSFTNAPHGRTVRAALVLALVALPLLGAAQTSERDIDPASLHMVMTPVRSATTTDSARAASIVYALRGAIAKYRDTTAAVADGYKLFAPQIKQQKVYHFTSNWMGVQEAFRFDPRKPTSLLYRKDASGQLVLVGAMYVAPKRLSAEQLDERVPLSVARWHKHVNWCLPPRGESQRWLERKDGHPVFGPESPVATKAECDAVHGVFRDTLFGWMVHANVFAGDDAKSIWGDEHAGHDMHEGMKMDASGT